MKSDRRRKRNAVMLDMMREDVGTMIAAREAADAEAAGLGLKRGFVPTEGPIS